jgi:hypothetical protein
MKIKLLKPNKKIPGFLFCFNILIIIYFLNYETIETHVRAFLPLNISAVGSVNIATISGI